MAWSSEHAPDGAVTFVCPGCTRADISQIEAGLPCLVHHSPAA
jgi:cell wall assembly regulator SMI1